MPRSRSAGPQPVSQPATGQPPRKPREARLEVRHGRRFGREAREKREAYQKVQRVYQHPDVVKRRLIILEALQQVARYSDASALPLQGLSQGYAVVRGRNVVGSGVAEPKERLFQAAEVGVPENIPLVGVDLIQ